MKRGLILAGVLALLLAAVVVHVYRAGVANGQNAIRAELLAQYQRQAAQLAEGYAADLAQLEAYQARQAEREVVYRTIEKEVIRYVTSRDPTDCIDADGVRLWNDIAAGRSSTADRPQPDGALSGQAADD